MVEVRLRKWDLELLWSNLILFVYYATLRVNYFSNSAYVIEKRDLTHGGGWVPAVNYVNPAFKHAQVPRLIEGTQYEFRVMAENLQGLSEPIATLKPVVAKSQFG